VINVHIQSAEKLNEATDAIQEDLGQLRDLQYQHADIDEQIEETNLQVEKLLPITNATPKIGRNDPCPCGSGKKYKVCHGKLD
jgi:preprotein translocase subunit SecA